MDRLFHGGYRAIDMVRRRVIAGLGEFVVLIMADILTRFAQEIERYMETSVMVVTFIHFGMIFKILTIVDCCLFDLSDRRIDTAYRFYFIDSLRPIARAVLDHPTCSPQVG